jgi:uncharacterized membrane protein YiaA
MLYILFLKQFIGILWCSKCLNECHYYRLFLVLTLFSSVMKLKLGEWACTERNNKHLERLTSSTHFIVII